MSVFVESWAASYGSPYLVSDDDDGREDVELIEDAILTSHPGRENGSPSTLAFIDGIRRVEASLYEPTTEAVLRAVAGAHACGAVIAPKDAAPGFEALRAWRLLVWNNGGTTALTPVAGWKWTTHSVASNDPAAPLAEIQARMRREEGRLAEGIADADALVVADGPLNFALRQDKAIVGYVKRHERAYLANVDHAAIPKLASGERSTIFRIGAERYSCYLRLTHEPRGGPWAGIIRLEFSSVNGFDRAQLLADSLACRLPRYAGILHRDPRAPQNLQPIGALEAQLRRLLGSEALAERAVRDAAARTSRRTLAA